MVEHKIKNLRGDSRRRFLKFATVVAAAAGVEQTGLLNYLADTGGYALAEGLKVNRLIGMSASQGGLAWFTQLFPHYEIAQANNNNFSYFEPGQVTMDPASDRPYAVGSATPFAQFDRRVTAFMCGANQTHTQAAVSPQMGNVSGLAAAAAIQSQLPALLPVIGVTPFSFGTAPGAPNVTTVGNPLGMQQLFNSAASRTLLAASQDANHYEAYYKAFLGLQRASGRPTFAKQLRITKASANFLGRNLATQLDPTSDYDRYGIGNSPPNNIRDLGRGLIIAVRAFKLGLTNTVILPALRDDPHGAFTNLNNLTSRVNMLRTMMDAAYADLADVVDPFNSEKTLADSTTWWIWGDTYKRATDRNGWGDGTANGSNVAYMLSARNELGQSLVKTGWFGRCTTDNQARGFDPATGEDTNNYNGGMQARAAAAALLFSITGGDAQAVDNIAGINIGGLVNAQLA